MNDFKEQLIELYKKSFDESDEYADYFFQNRYKQENVAAVIENGKVISALHLIPQEIMLCGKPVKAGYVSSAATLPEYRGKGLFAQTMAKADEMLKNNGMEYCVLYPFKHEYYRKFGFIEYSYVKKGIAVGNSFKVRVEEYKAGDGKLLNRIRGIYERLCGNFEGWVIRDDKEWEYRIGEILADRGAVLVIKADNEHEGYCFINKGRIEECCFTDFIDGAGDGEHCLIDGVTAAAGMEYVVPVHKPLNQIADADNIAAARRHPFGMIKKTGCTAAETYEVFKNKRCVLFDKY